MAACLLYGAAGYTGRLLARALRARGHGLILAGRSAVKLAALAAELDVEVRVFSLEDTALIQRALSGVDLVLNAAGPFSQTAPPWIDACLRARVHYLDITGEVLSIEHAAQRHGEARQRGIMLMPAVGFDVVPSDCLAAFVSRRIADPSRLRIGVSNLNLLSRGSARTIIAILDEPIWVRRNGQLRSVPHGTLEHSFDFGAGPRTAQAASWGDVVTAYFSTGIKDVTAYFDANLGVRTHNRLVRSFGWAVPLTPWQAWLHELSALLPEGPAPAQRKESRACIVVEVENAGGEVARARLFTPEAYSLTAETGAEVVARVLANDFEPGFQTPARVYGEDFILGFAGIRREIA